MRVLILNYEYPPLGGGAGIAMAALAQGLAERGIAVDVITSSAASTAERRTTPRWDEPLVEGSLRVYRVGSHRIGLPQAAGMIGAASYLMQAALPQAIGYLAADPELRAIMRARNRAKAEATLEWSQATRGYLSLYESVTHQLPVPSLVSQPPVGAL